ncbi:GMC oxidoreductase-domain-containing protein [Mycena vulgaris]|nr:GMC oxidoreductase-domain-containing protein [Mycena vulgaris]
MLWEGGTTACVVAGRLAAADSKLRILLIENGRHTKEDPFHLQPAHFLRNMLTPGAETLTTHSIVNPDGRTQSVGHGNCVGGASSVNGMMYNRAPASDYDDWMRLGNPGWGSHDLIPLAQKLETYQAGVVDDTHGSSGPIKVSHGGYKTKAGQDFLATAAGFPRGRNFTEDLNDFSTCNVYGRLPKFIDADTGRRSDTAHFYVYNQAHNPNLQILDHARVNRVVFDDDNSAVGVEYQVGGSAAPMLTARASRLVVLSAGTFCSPAILERSAIGARDVLEKRGISVVSELPGVGKNYKDHLCVMAPYLAPDNEVTLDSVYGDQAADFERQWLLHGKGLLATNCMDAAIKLRPNEQDLQHLTSLFKQRWETFFANAPDKAPIFVSSLAGHGGSSSTARPIHNLNYILSYPVVTGHVHIQSANPFTPLEIEAGLLDKYDRPEDVLLLRWAYKWSRELGRRMDSYRGEFTPGHPAFSQDSQARCGESSGPVEFQAPEIIYSAEDDAAIDAFHYAVAAPTWHALGTCAMKPRDQSGVVDSRLNVYGVRNLKVADMSIAPLNVGANTYHTALMIGEKAAILIAEDLGIRGV